MVKITFREAHKWLTTRGLKLDQVKNKLIHFTRSTRGRHAGSGPSITVPTNIPGKQKVVKPAKSIQYLGIWLDSQLKISEHVQKTTSKALTATHALKILGNSIRGMHQEQQERFILGQSAQSPCMASPYFGSQRTGSSSQPYQQHRTNAYA